MEELVYAGTKLSHSFAASPQISTKKRRAPQPPTTAGPALTGGGTDNSSQWYVSGPRYISSNIHKYLQNKREPSVHVVSSISVLSRDRKSKAFSSHTADPSKIAVETKCKSIKLAFLNIHSLKN